MAISRRKFLKNAGAVAAGVGLNPVFRATASDHQIEWWNPHGNPDFMKAWDTLLGELKQETGIEVTNSIVGWGDIIPRATQGKISNTLPDICTSWQSATQILGEMGALYDVTDTLAMIQQAGNTPNPSAVLASTYQGTPHGIPRYSTVHGLTYRGDLLEQAGIDPPDYAYGWEEFVEVCERLNNPPDRYVLAGIGATFDAEKLIWNIMASNGATIIDADGNLIWESDETVEAYRYLSDIYRRFSPPGVSGYDLADANRAYISGKAVMAAGDGDVNMDIEKSKPEWVASTGFMSSPVSKQPVAYGGGVHFALPKAGNLETASKFCEFMLRPDNLIRAIWPFRTLVVPATDTGASSDLLKTDATYQNWSNVLAQMGAVAQNTSGLAAYHGVTPAAGLIESSGIVRKVMEQILVNNVDPEKAVTDATSEIEDIIRG